ncbi:MAG: hypothetical protein QNJ16_00420 [Rhodobacter sp.]|nr:hypothetical protein [Rhodobacter sp.]
MPAWFAAMGLAMMQPVSPLAAYKLALEEFMASHQPRWTSRPVLEELDLSAPLTLCQYLDRCWSTV